MPPHTPPLGYHVALQAGRRFKASTMQLSMPGSVLRFEASGDQPAVGQPEVYPHLVWGADGVTPTSAAMTLALIEWGPAGPKSIEASAVLAWVLVVCCSADGRGGLPRYSAKPGAFSVKYAERDVAWPGAALRTLFVAVLGRVTAYQYVEAAAAEGHVSISKLLDPSAGIHRVFQQWAAKMIKGFFPTALVALATGYRSLSAGSLSAATLRELAAAGSELLSEPWRLIDAAPTGVPRKTACGVLRGVLAQLGPALEQRAIDVQHLCIREVRDCSKMVTVLQRRVPATFGAGVPLVLDAASGVGVHAAATVLGLATTFDGSATGPPAGIASRLIYREDGGSYVAKAEGAHRRLVSGSLLAVMTALHEALPGGARVLRITMVPHPDLSTGYAYAAARSTTTGPAFPMARVKSRDRNKPFQLSIDRAHFATWDTIASALLQVEPTPLEVSLHGVTALAPPLSMWKALLNGHVGSVDVTGRRLEAAEYLAEPAVAADPQRWATDLAAEARAIGVLSPAPEQLVVYRDVMDRTRRPDGRVQARRAAAAAEEAPAKRPRIAAAE